MVIPEAAISRGLTKPVELQQQYTMKFPAKNRLNILSIHYINSGLETLRACFYWETLMTIQRGNYTNPIGRVPVPGPLTHKPSAAVASFRLVALCFSASFRFFVRFASSDDSMSLRGSSPTSRSPCSLASPDTISHPLVLTATDLLFHNLQVRRQSGILLVRAALKSRVLHAPLSRVWILHSLVAPHSLTAESQVILEHDLSCRDSTLRPGLTPETVLLRASGTVDPPLVLVNPTMAALRSAESRLVALAL